MPARVTQSAGLQSTVWGGSLPLEIKLAASDCRTFNDSEPYFVQFPRLSYLALLLPELHAFFSRSLINPEVSPHNAWISFEEIPMKWHYPLGLLYDIFSGVEPVNLQRTTRIDQEEAVGTTDEAKSTANFIPWRLVIHYTDFPNEQLIQLDSENKSMQDMFINSVKEADYIRNGTARAVMSLGKEDSSNLWLAVKTQDRTLFNVVNNKLLHPPGMELRHVPLKVYLPTSATQETSETIPEDAKPGHIRVVQSLVSILLPSKQPQTLGTALNNMLPTIFPSRRNPILAQPVLHGATVPMAAPLEDLSSSASYPDGFLHIVIVMLG